MKILSPLAALVLAALPASGQATKPVLTGDKSTFQSPAAMAAQKKYFDTLQRARAAYAAELDPAIKAAMQAGSLDDANAINQLKADLAAGTMPPVPGQPSKIAAANDPRLRFERYVTTAQRQYVLELQPALKGAMAAGQLPEANAISAELKGLTATAAPAAIPFSPTGTTPGLGSSMESHAGPGLMMTRYPMHPTQKDGNKGGGYVPYTELGKPLGAPKMVKSILKWPKEIEENAVVAGLLKIEKAGTYTFNSASGWDRNELLIDGAVVCKFRDGEEGLGTVDLSVGLHPIVSVGYAHVTNEVRVKWKPPGAKDLVEIPVTLLSH